MVTEARRSLPAGRVLNPGWDKGEKIVHVGWEVLSWGHSHCWEKSALPWAKGDPQVWGVPAPCGLRGVLNWLK